MDLLFCGLVDVSCSCCVGEADGASEVAAVCDVDYGEGCMALVLWTDAAVLRASLHCLGSWIV